MKERSVSESHAKGYAFIGALLPRHGSSVCLTSLVKSCLKRASEQLNHELMVEGVRSCFEEKFDLVPT